MSIEAHELVCKLKQIIAKVLIYTLRIFSCLTSLILKKREALNRYCPNDSEEIQKKFPQHFHQRIVIVDNDS